MALKLKENANTQATEEKVAKTAKTAVKEKENAAVEAAIPVTEQDDSILESLADKISLVCPLGDPSVDDKTPVKVDGKNTFRIDPTIVGYKFVAEVDLEVPDCPPGEDFKTTGNLMSYTGDPFNTKTVKAGTPFILTKFETGVLLSRDEFNGKVNGGEHPCYCVYTKSSKKSASGQLATASGIASLPTVSLRANEGSIKDVKMENVLTFTSEKKENGQTRKRKTVVPGYEKFENLTKAATRAKVSTANTTAKVQRNKGSQAFLQILASRKAN